MRQELTLNYRKLPGGYKADGYVGGGGGYSTNSQLARVQLQFYFIAALRCAISAVLIFGNT